MKIQKNMSRKMLFWIIFALFAIFMLVPLPTRCFIDLEYFRAVNLNKGVASIDVMNQQPSVNLAHPNKSRCYSFFRTEFWQHPEWPLDLRSLFPKVIDQGPLILIHPTYPADFSIDANMMGASHNVFVGKVIKQGGTEEFMGHPATQYSVQIVRNIKGDLSGTVVVNQDGGYKEGKLYMIEDGSGLLQVGATYLLSTRFDTEKQYYTLNPHQNASKILSTDSSLDTTQLQELVEQDDKILALEAAYSSEVLIEADVKHSNTRNSFESLPPEQKVAAQARADVAKTALEASAVNQ